MGNFFKEFTKNVHKHDDLWDVLWVGQQFYQLLGLSPLRYRGQGKIPVPKRVPWGAIISSVVFLGFFVVHSVSDLATINSSSYILSNGFRWFQQLVSVFTSLVAAINAIYCKKIARLVFSLYDFDLKLSAIGYPMDQKSQNRWINSAALLISSFLVTLSALTAYLTIKISHGSFLKFSWAECFNGILSSVPIQITSQVFLVISGHYVNPKISNCNTFLFTSQLFPTEPEHVNSFRLASISKNRSLLNERIAQIADLHYFLIQLTARYNGIFAVQLMLTHLGATLITILSWFSVYRAVVSADGDSIFVVSINVSWSLYYSVYQFMYTMMGAQVSFEAKQMGVVVHKAIEIVTDEDIRDVLLLFSAQIDQRCPEISCQLFVLNGTLILSTIGFICTYLVVLIQFDLTSNV
uniref:Gustatory receptor n=1 Tax=Culex quinquefasciatus TaxID=7176 RepID=A0A1S4KI46_CULQU